MDKGLIVTGKLLSYILDLFAMLEVLYINFRSSILRGWGAYIYILNDFIRIQDDMEARSGSVATRSSFIASYWRNHKPFHTAHTSNLTLGIKSGHTLWVTERGNVFNQSGFMKTQFNTLTRQLSRSVTFVDTTREERGDKCTVMNKFRFAELLNASFTDSAVWTAINSQKQQKEPAERMLSPCYITGGETRERELLAR